MSKDEVVTVNQQGQIVSTVPLNVTPIIERINKQTLIHMVEIPGGEFMMGALAYKEGGWENERPQHRVTITPFYMSQFPVTQAQWEAVMRSNLSQFKGANRPVEYVSWNEAVKFCRKLSKKSGKDYRLPSEAEWEYACRAGTTTLFHLGGTMTPELANYNNAVPPAPDGTIPLGCDPSGESRHQTSDVGIFPPNAFGLYDMHGNVWEWCQDTWHRDYIGAPTDGSAWIMDGDDKFRILRGGSWRCIPRNCRSAYRSFDFPINCGNDIGFRVVCSASSTRQKPFNLLTLFNFSRESNN